MIWSPFRTPRKYSLRTNSGVNWLGTVVYLTSWCWWLEVGDTFGILMTEFWYRWHHLNGLNYQNLKLLTDKFRLKHSPPTSNVRKPAAGKFWSELERFQFSFGSKLFMKIFPTSNSCFEFDNFTYPNTKVTKSPLFQLRFPNIYCWGRMWTNQYVRLAYLRMSHNY